MNAFLGFVVKEFRHILRDRQTLAILLFLPLAQVVVFGSALRTDVRGVRLVVVDPTPDATTLELRSRFAATDLFEIVGVTPRTDALAAYFQRNDADQALIFPTGFGSALTRPDGAPLLLVTDATDPNTGSTMQAYATAVVQDYELEARTRARATTIVPLTRMRFNPTLESVNLFIPGLIALILTVVSALASAISLSREKERGTLEVLLVSPLKPAQIIAGKVLPYLVLGFANVLTVLAAAWLVFGVPFRGSVLLLLAECLLFIVVSLALGVLIASRTDSQRTAMIGALLGLMLPTTVLSGMIFPVASMPVWLRPVTHIIPGKWFVLISRGIMLKGAGITELWFETVVLAVMAAGFLVLAVRSFDVRLS